MCTICSDTSIDIEKPFKISAGPGAGKTRFLINHIRNVLSNSKRLNTVNNIACITYINPEELTFRQYIVFCIEIW